MITREQVLHSLYEAAELEHTLMCTYLYAAFSLKDGEAEGLRIDEAAAVARWRRTIHRVSFEEMVHLVAVWNITSAIGGSPRFGRGNFPLDGGELPAAIVVKLAPFSPAVVEHFVRLERPASAVDADGDGFAPERSFRRGAFHPRVTPMSFDYDSVGELYAALERGLRDLTAQLGEPNVFAGDPGLQLAAADVPRIGLDAVICLKTALASLAAIVTQGEGAPGDSAESHYRLFMGIRDELAALRTANPAFAPALPAATNPVLRAPVRAEARVWIENEEAARTVDVANAAYGLMMRMLAYSYAVPRSPEKHLALQLATGLMHAFTPLAERAARLPAGPSYPGCNAGVSFTALRDAAPFPPGPAARRAFVERFEQLATAAGELDTGDARTATAARMLDGLRRRASHGFAGSPIHVVPTAPPVVEIVPPSLAPLVAANGVERVAGRKLVVIYEGGKCMHARYCVTGAPKVFLANVKGPWIHPDAMDVERVVEIAHACPSGAIRYERTDGGPAESAPPVNLIAVRENGPYAARGELRIDGESAGYRATLCRCGASRSKPFCDNSHHDVAFVASGEPETESTEMLAVRDGELAIDPETDGPLEISGNLEITSGTGRVVARVRSARLCRCGASATKPMCDGSHARIGFRSEAPLRKQS